MTSLTILGSTGSIGRQTVELLLARREPCRVVALTGYRNVKLLAEQARLLQPDIAVIGDPRLGNELRTELASTGIEIGAGKSALIEAASREVELCLAAILGSAGLAPAVAALDSASTLGLANKEALVSAGRVFLERANKTGTRLVPVDSELSAIWRLLDAHGRGGLRRAVLPASGGPFRRRTLDQMARVTYREATRHPKWNMGKGISVDSASMFNKAIEMIETHYLFALEASRIEVLIHPQCVVHGLVEYDNGHIYAQLARPDMKIVIADTLGLPPDPPATDDASDAEAGRFGIEALSNLEFEPPDEKRFPALRLAREVLEQGGLSSCVFNAAHEVARDAFCEGRIGFLDMARIVEETLDLVGDMDSESGGFEDVYRADRIARDAARQAIRNIQLTGV